MYNKGTVPNLEGQNVTLRTVAYDNVRRIVTWLLDFAQVGMNGWFDYVHTVHYTIFLGQQVYNVRFRCGERLAVEAPMDADIVSNVPDTSAPSAKGYASKVGYWLLYHFPHLSIFGCYLIA